MTIQYKPKGVCSQLMNVKVEDGIIRRPLVTLGAVARRSFFSAAGAAALEGKPLTEETFDGLAAVLAGEASSVRMVAMEAMQGG